MARTNYSFQKRQKELAKKKKKERKRQLKLEKKMEETTADSDFSPAEKGEDAPSSGQTAENVDLSIGKA